MSSTSPRSQRGGLLTAAGLGLFGAASYLLGSLYPPSLIALAFPAPAPPPSLASSPEGQAEIARVEALLQALPQVKELRSQSSQAEAKSSRHDLKVLSPRGKENATTAVDSTEASNSDAHYQLSRPFEYYPPHMLTHSLTGSSLRKPGMLAVPPLVLSKTAQGAAKLGGSQGDAYTFVHLGRSMCGHDGIIHGGLLATVLDEVLARTSFFNLPHHVGVTARLEIDYRFPVKADQVVVVETELIEAKGRKAIVKGVMKTLNGDLLVESKAIFVEPKMIKWLNTSEVKRIMDIKAE